MGEGLPRGEARRKEEEKGFKSQHMGIWTVKKMGAEES